MARASSAVSARAMALASLTQHRNRTKLADFCSAPVAGFYAAVDSRAAYSPAMDATNADDPWRLEHFGACRGRKCGA